MTKKYTLTEVKLSLFNYKKTHNPSTITRENNLRDKVLSSKTFTDYLKSLSDEELNNIDDNSDLSNAIKKTINDTLEEIKDAKRDFKKIDNLQETIHIPLEEIKYQINELSKKKTPKETQKENKLLEDTMFISNDIDINKAIEKELKTKEKNQRKKPQKRKQILRKKNNLSFFISTRQTFVIYNLTIFAHIFTKTITFWYNFHQNAFFSKKKRKMTFFLEYIYRKNKLGKKEKRCNMI